MAEPAAEAMARRLDGCGRDELVFCGPGGSNGVPRGEREGSMIGTRYRHMTEAMRARVVAVLAERLTVALAAMPQVCPRTSQGRRRRAEAGRDTAVDLRFCGGGAEGI